MLSNDGEDDETPRVESVEDLIRSFIKQLQQEGDPIPDLDPAMGGDAEEDDIDTEEDRDPYEVTLAEYRRVSHEEYAHTLVEPIDRSIGLQFAELVQTARHTTMGGPAPPHIAPHDYHQHDPIALVRATAIACNMKLWARLAASHVPHSELQTLENYDTTKVLHFMRNKPEAKQKLDQVTSEFLYAVMTVDVATRDLPAPIARIINK